MIRVRDLDKHYGTVRAVQNVTFDVTRGEIVGLLGHNGAGKSTVMKIITGYLEPSNGSVSVGDIDVLADRIGVQRLIGYLPESAPLYPEMLVQEYLLMIAELRGIPAERRQQAVSDAVHATGLEEWLVRPIGTLSKGYRQRVGLAQAMVHKPEVLVLDEPTSGLDPVQIVEIRSLIRRLASHSTVILSTHILSEIEAVCDRVLILIDGVLAADSRLADLLASEHVRLSATGGGNGFSKALEAVDGIDSALHLGPDPRHPGYELWSLACTTDVAPTAEIVAAATSAGATVASVGAETRSLEQVFRDLMEEHIARHAVVAGQGAEKAA
jgi:ABC-2 type transport system ATP-binding protein